MTVTRFAPAKINLSLHVGRPQSNGRHPLDSLVVFSRDAGDLVMASHAQDLQLSITGAFAVDLPVAQDNLVLRAARLIGETFGVAPRAALTLDKRLPIASGIGGGSADAAAALLALNDLWGLGASLDALEQIAKRLGADVPACVRSRTLRMTGTGEDIENVTLAQLHAVLVNPREPAPTVAVYRAFDEASGGRDIPAAFTSPPVGADVFPWLASQTNDLEFAARMVVPTVGQVLETLRRLAPSGSIVRMSGSGATCFALVADRAAAEILSDEVGAARPDWWVCPASLG